MKTALTTQDVNIAQNYNTTDKSKLCSGIVISAALNYFNILSVCDGIVLQVNKSLDGKWTVIVQYDADNVVKYNYLLKVSVRMGQPITAGQIIGEVRSSMKFEYLTPNENNVFNPVRFGGYTYYPADPTDIALGNKKLSNDLSEYVYVDWDVEPMPEDEIPEEFKINNAG